MNNLWSLLKQYEMSLREVSVLQAYLLAISISLMNAGFEVLFEDVTTSCGFIATSLFVFLLVLFVARDANMRGSNNDSIS